MDNNTNPLFGYYRIRETIGSGGFAKVKLGYHNLTGDKVAIKIIDKEALGDDLPRVKKEVEAMMRLSHKHICQLYQVIETERKIYMILEYCPGGELFDYIVANDRLSEHEAIFYFRQIVAAMKYCHSHGYAHRDLKPENLLLDSNQDLKLIDFGLCANPQGGINQCLTTCCGSPAYAAPELISGKEYLGFQVDIWSMGVLLYALLCGYLPFDDENVVMVYRKIQNGSYTLPEWVTEEAAEFLQLMLEVDPPKRANIDDLMIHDWLCSNYVEPIIPNGIDVKTHLDEECITEISLYQNKSVAEISKSVGKWKYNYMTATYLLLYQKKMEGRPVAFLYQRPLFERNRLSVNIKDILESSACNLHLKVLKENTKHNISRANKQDEKTTPQYEKTPIPCYKVSPEGIYENAELNKRGEFKLRPDMKTMSPSRSMDSQLENVKHVQKMNESRSGSVRDNMDILGTPTRSKQKNSKVLSNIEKSFGKMKNILTPKKYKTNVDAVRKLKGRHNMTKPNNFTPAFILLQIKNALMARRINYEKIAMYIVRCCIKDDWGKEQMVFDLEIVETNKFNSHCIHYKRVRGDVWHYKKIVKDVLILANLW